VDNVLLERLPYPESDELVFFDRPAHSIPLFRDWRDRTHSFSEVGAVWDAGFDLTGDGTPENIPGGRVTEDFLQMLGARPERGRFFVPEDFVGIPARVVVLSHELWQRRWGSDSSIVGRTITLNGFPMEVVGVVDPGFVPPVRSRAELWLPLDVNAEDFQSRGMFVLSVIARLRAGVSLEAAQADVDRLSLELAGEFPESYRERDGSPTMRAVIPLLAQTVEDVGHTLYLLLGAVGLMLLIACANVANLFLARGTDRSREMALRAALGAGRGRIAGQLLTESVLLGLIGGALGVVLAVFGVSAFKLYSPGGIPRMESISVDPRVLAFAMVVSVATGVLFGIVPAFRAARSDVRAALGETAVVREGRRTLVSLRSGLVVAEIALALMLLVGAGLLFRSFISLRSVDTGFSTDNVVVLELDIGDRFKEQQRVSFTRALLERIEAIPGVESVGAGTTVPPTGRYMCCWMGGVRTDDTPEFEDEWSTVAHPITPDYFTALGAVILRGRDFTAADDDIPMGSAIINESLATYLFDESNPIGRSFWYRDVRLNVVGVVNDIRHWQLSHGGDYNVYLPYAAYGERFGLLQVAVKSAIDPGALTGTLRDVVWSIDRDLPIGDVIQLRHKVAQSIAQPRFLSILVLTFATLSILLAAGGIYGSLLYSVGQRHKEMGIRLALGAGTGSVVTMILRSGLLLTVAGLSIGLGGAFALSRTLESLLFEVTPADPGTFVVVPLLLGTVAMVACYIPARKAAKADPIETLRAE
jgi:predicted permease